MVTPRYVGQHPRNRETGWSEGLQGVTHDQENWYFTQTGLLWKFPVEHNLNQAIGLAAFLSRRFPAGVSVEEMPDTLRRQGYDHFGDPVFVGGRILVPAYGGGPSIVIAFRQDLSYSAHQVLPGIRQTCWLAVDMSTEPRPTLFSSGPNASGAEPIRRFFVDPVRVANDILEFRDAGIQPLRDESGAALILDHMQGGVIEGGRLYLTNGYPGYTSTRSGVHVVDISTGTRILRSSSTERPFLFQFNPAVNVREEPEGITWWDLDDGRAPNISGQLHVLMLDNDPLDSDDMYFKHYRVAPRSRVTIPARPAGRTANAPVPRRLPGT